MDVLAILFGCLFWPLAIAAWFIFGYCRCTKAGRIVGCLVILGLPALAIFSEADWALVQEPLFRAAIAGDTERLDHFSALGASPDAVSEGGNTALAWAVANQHPLTVRILLAHHANPNVRMMGGGSVLTAAQGGDTQIVIMLKAAGAKE